MHAALQPTKALRVSACPWAILNSKSELMTCLHTHPRHNAACSRLCFAKSTASQVEAQELVVDGMKMVFRLHGAAPMASTGVGIAPPMASTGVGIAEWAPDAVSLLAPCGDLWGLRYDLRYPFVGWLARQASLLTTSTPPPLCMSDLVTLGRSLTIAPHSGACNVHSC